MAKRILIVGDNHGVDPVLLSALGRMEVELEVAQNPVAAYPKLWKCAYDLVVAETESDAAKQEEMLKVLWQARRGCPRAEIIIIADFCGPDLARHAQELGVAFCLKREEAPGLLEGALTSLGLNQKPVPSENESGRGLTLDPYTGGNPDVL